MRKTARKRPQADSCSECGAIQQPNGVRRGVMNRQARVQRRMRDHLGSDCCPACEGTDTAAEVEAIRRGSHLASLVDVEELVAIPRPDVGSPIRSLPHPLRRIAEAELGVDGSAVKLHVGASAARATEALHAEAFTVGSDIFFAEGQLDLGTTDGLALVFHELVHVSQQRDARAIQRQDGEPDSGPEADLAEVVERLRLHLRGRQVGWAVAEFFGLELHPAVADLLGREEPVPPNPAEAVRLLRAEQTRGQKIHNAYLLRYGHTPFEDLTVYATEEQVFSGIQALLPVLDLRSRLRLYMLRRRTLGSAGALAVIVDGEFGERLLDAPAVRFFSDAVVLEALQQASREELDFVAMDEHIMALLEDELDSRSWFDARLLLETGDHYDAVVEYLTDDGPSLGVSGVLDVLFELPADRRHDAFMEAGLSLSLDLDSASRAERSALTAMHDGDDVAALSGRLAILEEGDVEGAQGAVERLGQFVDRREEMTQRLAMFEAGAPVLDDEQTREGLEAELRTLEAAMRSLRSESLLQGMMVLPAAVRRRLARRLAMPVTMARHEVREADDFSEIASALNALTPSERAHVLSDPALEDRLDGLEGEERLALEELSEGDSFGTHELTLRPLAESDDLLGVLEYILGHMDAQSRDRLWHHHLFRTLDRLPSDVGNLIPQAVNNGRLEWPSVLSAAFRGPGGEPRMGLVRLGLGTLDEATQHELRLGYVLSRGSRDVDADEQGAVDEFERFVRRMDVEGLSHDERQEVLDLAFGVPDLRRTETARERRLVAQFLWHRVADRGLLEPGVLGDALSTGDEDAHLAALEFRAAYSSALEDRESAGEITAEELQTLAYLESVVARRVREGRAELEQIASIAETVASIAVGLVVAFVTGGTGLFALGLLEAAGAAGAIGAVTSMATNEAILGEHFDWDSEEGMRSAIRGAVDASVGVLSNQLASNVVRNIGRSGGALASGLSSSVAEASAAAATHVGERTLASSAVRAVMEGAIDGAISGAVGGAVMSALDEQNWRRSIWERVMDLGLAALRDATIGAATGAVVSGTLHSVGEVRRRLREGGGGSPAELGAVPDRSAAWHVEGSPTLRQQDVPSSLLDVDGVPVRPAQQITLAGQADHHLSIEYTPDGVPFIKICSELCGRFTARIDSVLERLRPGDDLESTLLDLRGQVQDVQGRLASNTLDGDRAARELQSLRDRTRQVVDAHADLGGAFVDPLVIRARRRRLTDEAREALRARRGDGPRPNHWPEGWTGEDEALWLEYPKARPGHQWVRDPSTGRPIHRRRTGERSGLPRLVWDPATSRFRLPEVRAQADVQVTSLEDALDKFVHGFHDGDRLVQSSFSQYMEALEIAGIIRRPEDVLQAFQIPRAPGLLVPTPDAPVPLSDIRHALKQYYEPQLLAHVQAGSNRAERLQRLLDIVSPLNSSDQGQLAELFYRTEFDLSADVATQVGLNIGDQRRVCDFVDPATGHTVEVKSGANAPTPSDLEQLDAMMEAVTEGVEVPLGDAVSAELRRHRLVLLDPAAASNRFGEIADRLLKPEYQGRLEIMITGPDGNAWLLSRSSAAHLAQFSSLSDWWAAGHRGARRL